MMDSPDGPAALRVMKRWIQECESQHDRCKLQSAKLVPTRLLDVDTSRGEVFVSLIETAGMMGIENENYVALSYCWGLEAFLNTTTATLGDRKNGILLERWARFLSSPRPSGADMIFSMPRTLQDAIRITHLLGFHYIWIDSLCILQDSQSDWKSEASNMNLIYKNAHVVIAAVSSTDAHSGFLTRPSSFEATFQLPVDTQALGDAIPNCIRTHFMLVKSALREVRLEIGRGVLAELKGPREKRSDAVLRGFWYDLVEKGGGIGSAVLIWIPIG